MWPHIITTNGSQYVLERFAVLLCQPDLCILVDRVDAACRAAQFQFAVKPLASDLDIDIPLVNFQVAPYLAAGSRGTGKAQPIACGMRGTARHNVHNLAATQFVVQRHHTCDKPLAVAAPALRDDARSRTV